MRTDSINMPLPRTDNAQILDIVDAMLKGHDTGRQGDTVVAYLQARHAVNRIIQRLEWRTHALDKAFGRTE